MASSTHDRLLPAARYGVCKEIIKFFIKGEDICPDSMMFIHDVYNNILNSSTIFQGISRRI